MSDQYNYDRPDIRQHYKGMPHDQTEAEKSLWRKFLENLFPWMKKKWELGDQYLEARVRKEQAIASSYAADTKLKLAQEEKVKLEAQKEALQIAEQAAKLEQQKLKQGTVDKQLSEEELLAEITKLAELLHILKLKYGLEMRLDLNDLSKDSVTINFMAMKEKYEAMMRYLEDKE